MSPRNAAKSENAAKKEIRKGPRVLGRVILIVVLIAGVTTGLYKGLQSVKYVSTDDASIDGDHIDLASRVLGRIDSILPEEGQRVKAGEVLVLLDNTDLKAQETQVQASLVSARQNLVIAEINRTKAGDDFSRISRLYNSSAATRENYEHASSALEAARAQYDLARAQVDAAEAQLGVIEAQLMNTSIKSPMDGTVTEVRLEDGDIVQPGGTILSVSNLDKVWVMANIEETYIRKVVPGASVQIRVDAFGRKSFKGTVEMIRAGIVPPAFQIGEFTKTTQRIPVRIAFSGDTNSSIPEGELRLVPGMSVEVKIRSTTKLPGFLDR